MLSLRFALQRLSIRSVLVPMSSSEKIHTNSHPMQFRCSQIVNAEPLRKKRRIDPQVIRERAEKKIKRLQRDIRKLERVSRQLKPIAELEVPKKVLRDSERVRPPSVPSESELQEQYHLRQQWAIFKRKQHLAEMYVMQRVINAQEKALDALQEASPELYAEALQPDVGFIPLKMTGPVETPPIEKYDYPDGEYFDVTKVYQPIIPSDPKKPKKLGFKKKK